MTKTDEAMRMLDQLQDLLIRLDTKDAKDRTPTVYSLLILARITYWMLERYIREH